VGVFVAGPASVAIAPDTKTEMTPGYCWGGCTQPWEQAVYAQETANQTPVNFDRDNVGDPQDECPTEAAKTANGCPVRPAPTGTTTGPAPGPATGPSAGALVRTLRVRLHGRRFVAANVAPGATVTLTCAPRKKCPFALRRLRVTDGKATARRLRLPAGTVLKVRIGAPDTGYRTFSYESARGRA
jgi:hypothetical protein